MAHLSPESANYAKGFLSPLPKGQSEDFFNPKFDQSTHSYDSWSGGPNSFISPLSEGQNHDNFFDSRFEGQPSGPVNGGANLSGILGKDGLGIGGMINSVLGGIFGGGQGQNNDFTLSGINNNNTANSGYLTGGNSMGLNGGSPTAGSGSWSDNAGSYGTGDGQTWHTDDYNWNGSGDGGSDSSSGGYDSFSGDDATDGGYDAGWGDDGTGDDSGEY